MEITTVDNPAEGDHVSYMTHTGRYLASLEPPLAIGRRARGHQAVYFHKAAKGYRKQASCPEDHGTGSRRVYLICPRLPARSGRTSSRFQTSQRLHTLQ